ncbi:lipopolysaccharide biosynthesis protein [Sedimenticola selenatireducens]|uniref:Lipopolysaccharide biosynthesis protein n=1 Tax=Sedimenticola selenatireducens TaxID=191960 RepID=A0A2N6D050_9GAMM|nr:lipopolysaccharide biosynthesis protein [Sedimenticola selenatireducens]PLX63039.1 MAG: hypothetical protein C0630_02425 [Sedimenticola selenatireducens]
MASIRNSLIWSLGEKNLGQIIRLISAMILARLLTPREIGIYSLCAALLAVASIFRDFGVSEYIIQEKNLTREKLSGAYALTTLTAWLMAAGLFFSRDLFANFYNEPALIAVLNILCINFVIFPLASPGFALLNREMQFRNIFVVQFSSTIVHALTAVTLAFMGFSYMSLAWASLTGIAFQTLLIMIYRPRDSLIFPNPLQIPHVWRFGVMFSSSRAIDTLNTNVHEFVIGRRFGMEALGIFSLALGLINLFWNNVTAAVTRVASPAFASTYRNSEEQLIILYRKAVAVFTVIAWPFFSFVALESERIIYLLFGDQWLAAAPLASILAISALISAVFSLAPNALIAMGHVKRRLQISLLIAPVHIIGIGIASLFDTWTVAAVWIISWSVALMLYNYHLSATLRFTYIDLIKSTLGSFKVTLITISTLILATQLLEMAALHDLLILPLQAGTVALAWFLSVRLLKHPVQEEIMNVYIQFRSAKGQA